MSLMQQHFVMDLMIGNKIQYSFKQMHADKNKEDK